LVNPVRSGAASVRRPQSPLRLSLEERETISRGLAQKKTLTAIAGELSRSVSTVSREVARNSGPNGYRAAGADRLAVLRTSRPRAGKLADDPTLRRLGEAADALVAAADQPPAGHRPSSPRSMRSHETIYTSLFVQTKAVLGIELTSHLRTRRVRRCPQRRVLPRSQSRRIPDMVPISQRPDSVLDRTVPGHWEYDLLVGR
jgi:transposase, IS30 family